jgi:hypothetical protein
MTEEHLWIPLATRAFNAAIRGDMPLAARLVERIDHEHGSDAVVFSALAWIDSMWQVVEKPPPDHEIGFRGATTGHVTDEDGVPPQIAWAGRLMSARAGDDADMVEELLFSVNDAGQWGRNVMALLDCVGLTIRAAMAERMTP